MKLLQRVVSMPLRFHDVIAALVALLAFNAFFTPNFPQLRT
ncbi:hypothetical protein [Ruegeria profundi]